MGEETIFKAATRSATTILWYRLISYRIRYVSAGGISNTSYLHARNREKQRAAQRRIHVHLRSENHFFTTAETHTIQDYCMHKGACVYGCNQDKCMYICRHPDIGSLLSCSVTSMMRDKRDRESWRQMEMVSVQVNNSITVVPVGNEVMKVRKTSGNPSCTLVMASACSPSESFCSL